VLGTIAVIVTVLWKLLRSKSEGGRRFRIVAGIAALLLFCAILIESMGVVRAIVVVIAIAAIVWVIKGFTSSAPSVDSGDVASNFDVPNESQASQIGYGPGPSSNRKTVIECPNCGEKSRVVAGKYIDVTCPHCHTVFRTHT